MRENKRETTLVIAWDIWRGINDAASVNNTYLSETVTLFSWVIDKKPTDRKQTPRIAIIRPPVYGGRESGIHIFGADNEIIANKAFIWICSNIDDRVLVVVLITLVQSQTQKGKC